MEYRYLYLVYDVPVFELWKAIASASVHCPRIDAAMVLAAERAFENARCTPDEKNGSICGRGDVQMRNPQRRWRTHKCYREMSKCSEHTTVNETDLLHLQQYDN
jgi:hypothetical protein